jgi:hypothetical protein
VENEKRGDRLRNGTEQLHGFAAVRANGRAVLVHGRTDKGRREIWDCGTNAQLNRDAGDARQRSPRRPAHRAGFARYPWTCSTDKEHPLRKRSVSGFRVYVAIGTGPIGPMAKPIVVEVGGLTDDGESFGSTARLPDFCAVFATLGAFFRTATV